MSIEFPLDENAQGFASFKDLVFIKLDKQAFYLCAKLPVEIAVPLATKLTEDIHKKLFSRYEDWRSKTYPMAYAYSMLKNAFLDFLRRQKNDPYGTISVEHDFWEEHLPHLANEDDSNGIQNRQVELIKECLAEMPETQRAAFTLHHVHKLSFREIATALSISYDTAKTSSSRAKIKIVQHLQENKIK